MNLVQYTSGEDGSQKVLNGFYLFGFLLLLFFVLFLFFVFAIQYFDFH